MDQWTSVATIAPFVTKMSSEYFSISWLFIMHKHFINILLYFMFFPFIKNIFKSYKIRNRKGTHKSLHRQVTNVLSKLTPYKIHTKSLSITNGILLRCQIRVQNTRDSSFLKMPSERAAILANILNDDSPYSLRTDF